jgi:hypothetical protein
MTLDDEMLDAEAREEQGQRQPDEAAADDEDRDLFSRLRGQSTAPAPNS